MANNGNGNGKAATAAYVSYVTFRNFLKAMAEHPLPNRIDSSLMSNHSGGTQSQIITALKFFDLIDQAGNRRPNLEKVVNAAPDDEQWANVARNILLPQYDQVIADIDITRATQAQLDQTFKDHGADGSVLIKSVRFYLKLLEDSGTEYSGHLRKTRRRGAGGARRAPRKRKSSASSVNSQNEPLVKGMIDIPLYFKGRQQGMLRVPPDFGDSDNDVQVIDAAVVMAKVYAQQEGGDND